MTLKNRLGIIVLMRITALTRITVLISLVLAINSLNFLLPHLSQAQYEPMNPLHFNFPVESNSSWWGNYTSLDSYNYSAYYPAYYPGYLSDMTWWNDDFNFSQSMYGLAYQWGNYMWGENLTARSSSNDQAGYSTSQGNIQGNIQGNMFYSNWQLNTIRSRQADSYNPYPIASDLSAGDGVYGGLGSIMAGALPAGPTVPYANPGSSDGFYCVYPYPGSGFGECSRVPMTREQWLEQRESTYKDMADVFGVSIQRTEILYTKDGKVAGYFF